jgi:NAD(P)H-hydrate epimerase
MQLLTAAEMRAVDQATIAAGTPGNVLMERAGLGVAEALERRWGSALALRVLVLAGGGNNGGDGLVAARALAARGARVAVALCAARVHSAGDARGMFEQLAGHDVWVRRVGSDDELLAFAATLDEWDFVIDALLGTGAEGEPHGIVADACRLANALRARGARVLAVDLPTGVSSDDGAVATNAVHADATVTFGHARRGHYLFPGRALCGTLDVVDIGLVTPEQAGAQPAGLASLCDLASRVPVRAARAHKGVTGRALLVGGAPGMTGALVLAANAAVRAGAGYVRVAAPASLQATLAAHLVEPMVLACGEDQHRTLARTALPLILAEAERANAVAVGSGLSLNPDAAALVRELATHLARPLVLDADALTALSPAADLLVPALRLAPAPRILTPHLGEMQRLTGQSTHELESRRIDIARGWAQRWGAVVVLKGAPTIVADPDGRVSVNPTGCPAMATAGAGDVLTGALVALLAQGLQPYDAALLAVFAHGLAGELAAKEVGDIGASATDIGNRLPRALMQIRAAR